MEVKVNVAGQEIRVPLTPEQKAELDRQYEVEFMSNFFRETSSEIRRNANFTTDETDLLVDELFHPYPNLQELCEAIIADRYLGQVEELADGIVEDRAKYYRVTMKYSGEFEVVVKATSKEEARDYVETLTHYDLCDKISAEDAFMEVDYVDEDSFIEDYEVDFDATE